MATLSDAPIYYTKHEIDKSDEEAVIEALRSGWLTQGPKVEEFEERFKTYCEAPYAIAVNNGTSALHLAVAALGLKAGQKVLVTSLSFVASANCVLYQGGEVEFVDISPNSFNISLEDLRRRIEDSPAERYAGIICVDFAGSPVFLEDIYNIAKSKNLWIIEDASHAPGAHFVDSSGKKIAVGSCRYSDVATFSFHPAKHVACGEGGMVTTRESRLHKRLLSIRTHGITKNINNPKRPWLQDMHELGFNFRMSDINAALGLSQLKKLEESIVKRNKIAKIYESRLSSVPQITTPTLPSTSRHALHLYVVLADERDELFLYLRERNIHCQIHYVPIYRMSYYKNIGYNPSDYPNTENYFKKCISIPMYPGLEESEIDYIVLNIKSFYSTHG